MVHNCADMPDFMSYAYGGAGPMVYTKILLDNHTIEKLREMREIERIEKFSKKNKKERKKRNFKKEIKETKKKNNIPSF